MQFTQSSSFKKLKQAFTTALILVQWEPGNPLIVEADASDYALGAILSRVTPLDNQVQSPFTPRLSTTWS